jgi:hypothetical protein
LNEQFDILNVDVVRKLMERYSGIHKVIFLRTLERTKNPFELFDALDSFPKEFPVSWDNKDKHWITTNLF